MALVVSTKLGCARSQEMGRLRVLHLLGPLRLSGAEMMLLSAADFFLESKLALFVASIASEHESSAARHFDAAGFEVLHLGAGRLRWLYAYWRTLGTLRADCVHVHAEKASIATTILPRLRRIRVVRTVHSEFGFGGALRVRKLIERWVARHLGVVFVAVSPSVQENELKRFSNSSQVILNWFNERHFVPPTPVNRSSARAKYEADGRVVIAVIGNCSAVKNHIQVFNSLALCPSETRPLVLHAGDSEFSDFEKKLVSELGLDADVRFLGAVSDVLPLLHAADAFLMPSMYEGLSVAAIEAAATGLPLILSDVAGLRIFADLFPNVELVSMSAERLSAVMQMVEPLGAGDTRRLAAAARAKSTFDRGAGARKYLELYPRSAKQGCDW